MNTQGNLPVQASAKNTHWSVQDTDMDPETVVKIEGYSIEYIDENDESFDDTNGLHSFQNCDSVSDTADVDFQQNLNLEKIAKPAAVGPELLLQLPKAKDIKKDSTTQEGHKCSIANCIKIFPTKRKLRVHLNYDHGQNWFKCHLCEKTYPTRGGVGRHLRIHFPTRPHLCNLCPKSFKVSGALVSHQRRVHCTSKTKSTTTHVRRSQPVLEKQQSSSNANNVVIENQGKAHGALHSVSDAKVVEQCHKCSIPNCSKTFSTLNKLSAHKIREHGEASFKCDLCEKSFLSRTVLHTHFITHSVPHRCRLCLKPFKYERNLWSHYLKVHEITRENKRGRPTSHFPKQSQLRTATTAAGTVDMEETLIVPDLINPWFPTDIAQANQSAPDSCSNVNTNKSSSNNKSDLQQHDLAGGKIRQRKQVHTKTHQVR